MEYTVIIFAVCIIVISYLNHRRNMRLLCSVSSPDRGTRAERRLVVKMLKKGVQPEAIFHDLYLQKKNGEFSQIDIVVVTPQGLIVIEVKDYSGWIFGNEKQRYWTKVLNYGKEKYRFYNPLMQNAGHIKALKEQSLQLSRLPVFNIVLFAGNCTLKNVSYGLPGAYVGYARDIKSILKDVAKRNFTNYTDKRDIIQTLSRAVDNGKDLEIVASHIESVRRRSVEDRLSHFSGW